MPPPIALDAPGFANPLPLAGVVEREGTLLEGAVPASCFVGDVIPLGGRFVEGRCPGLGLGALSDILFAKFGSGGGGFPIVELDKLLGRLPGFLPAFSIAGRDGGLVTCCGGAGSSTNGATLFGLTNMPYPISQSK